MNKHNDTCLSKTGHRMSESLPSPFIHLLGLDFGSTTTSALVARANIVSNSVTGQMELGNIQTIYRSEVIFTPFIDGLIDEAAILEFINTTLCQAGYEAQDFMAGGVIITGLAARADNAGRLSQLIEARIGEVLIATADDPSLESWLAFMGSCGALSRYHAGTCLINLDIGGGTTNPALGLNGAVLKNGCYFVGARHFQFIPGTYTIKALTTDARYLLEKLSIRKNVGETLTLEEKKRIVDGYILILEQIAAGRAHDFLMDTELGFLEQVNFTIPETLCPEIAITFSGGVGELVYQLAEGGLPLSTTCYGDFGVDLALGILESPILSRSLQQIVPENRGRATVYGLALHSTEISGTTLYLPDEGVLPLRHLPILGQFDADSSVEIMIRTLENLLTSKRGGCIQIMFATAFRQQERLMVIRETAARIRNILMTLKVDTTLPVVIIVDENIAKTLGAYISDWGAFSINLIVIDEIFLREASFVNIGRAYQQVVPVSFYGMH